MPLNHDRPFLAVNIALLTVSDTRNAADDRSGDTLAERAAAAGHRIAARQIVRDDFDAIDDFTKSLEEAYRAIRERKANGGEGWIPKEPET